MSSEYDWGITILFFEEHCSNPVTIRQKFCDRKGDKGKIIEQIIECYRKKYVLEIWRLEKDAIYKLYLINVKLKKKRH